MFNNIESYIVDLLQNRITYNDRPVQLFAKFTDAPTTPCLTIDMNARPTTESVRRVIDTTENVHYYRNISVDINLWANTPEMRDDIVQQIMDLFFMSQNDHYMFCSHYDKNNNKCKHAGVECLARTGKGARALKNLCPDPDGLDYENIATRHNIIHGGVNIEPPYYILDNADRPPLYRAIFKVDAEYIDKVNAGGKPTEDMETGIRII